METDRHERSELVTIGNLVDTERLRLRPSVWPPGSAERPVTWVHVTEQTDPRPHIRADELICTLGSSLVRSRSAEPFVAALVESGCAALCLGLGEVHVHPPSELVDTCSAKGLPLLILPHGVPFTAVNDVIMERRQLVESAARNRETASIFKLLRTASSGADERTIVELTKQELGIEFQPVSGSKRNLQCGHRGLLANGHGTTEALTPELSSQLSHIFEIAKREKERISQERSARLGKLVNLIAEDLALPAVLAPDLDDFGLIRSNLRVSCWPRESGSALAERLETSVIALATNDVVVLSRPEDDTHLNAIGLIFGYSSPVALEHINRGVGEARAALSLARSRGEVTGPDQMVSLEALLEQQSLSRLLPFNQQLISPLVDSDATSHNSLVLTLGTFLEEEGDLHASAAKLFVHINTVRNRLNKISRLTGRNPMRSKDAIDLRIALFAQSRQKRMNRWRSS